MDKLIIFDWGGVIECHHGNGRTADESWIAVMRRLGATGEDYILLRNIYDADYAFDIHTVNEPCVFEEFAKILCMSCNVTFPGLQEFLAAYNTEFDKTDYYQEIIDLICNLQGCCQLALMANILLPDKERIERRISLSMFDHTWLSITRGESKIDYLMSVEDTFGVLPQNILLVDNNPTCIRGGIARGWNVHLAEEGRPKNVSMVAKRFLGC